MLQVTVGRDRVLQPRYPTECCQPLLTLVRDCMQQLQQEPGQLLCLPAVRLSAISLMCWTLTNVAFNWSGSEIYENIKQKAPGLMTAYTAVCSRLVNELQQSRHQNEQQQQQQCQPPSGPPLSHAAAQLICGLLSLWQRCLAIPCGASKTSEDMDQLVSATSAFLVAVAHSFDGITAAACCDVNSSSSSSSSRLHNMAAATRGSSDDTPKWMKLPTMAKAAALPDLLASTLFYGSTTCLLHTESQVAKATGACRQFCQKILNLCKTLIQQMEQLQQQQQQQRLGLLLQLMQSHQELQAVQHQQLSTMFDLHLITFAAAAQQHHVTNQHRLSSARAASAQPQSAAAAATATAAAGTTGSGSGSAEEQQLGVAHAYHTKVWESLGCSSLGVQLTISVVDQSGPGLDVLQGWLAQLQLLTDANLEAVHDVQEISTAVSVIGTMYTVQQIASIQTAEAPPDAVARGGCTRLLEL